MSIIVKERVHELYWKEDINCARTMLVCLSEQFQVKLEEQTLHAAIGLHGAGGYGAQCGLVEGGLLFIGLYFKEIRKTDEEIIALCYQYAESFSNKFHSLACHCLRPGGFQEDDPPHACEKLTVEAVEFAINFVEEYLAAK